MDRQPELAISCNQDNNSPPCHHSHHPVMDGNRCRDLQQSTGLYYRNSAEEKEMDWMRQVGQGYHKEIHRNDQYGLIGCHRLWTDRKTA